MSELRMAGPDTRTLKEILDSINEVAVTLDYMPCRAIQEDIAEIAYRFAAGSWISVEDALPHAEYGEGTNVLTIDTMGLQRVAEWNGGNWCWPTGEVIATCGKFPITHWMPLPKPPLVEVQ